MLSNTLTLTAASIAGSPFTLTRVKEAGGTSEYLFRDATQEIILTVRQTTDKNGGLPVYRHNCLIRHTLFATLVAPSKFGEVSITIRDSQGYGPSVVKALWDAFNTLYLTIDDAIVVGDN